MFLSLECCILKSIFVHGITSRYKLYFLPGGYVSAHGLTYVITCPGSQAFSPPKPPYSCPTGQVGLFWAFWPWSRQQRQRDAEQGRGVESQSVYSSRAARDRRWSLSWPAGPAGHYCRAAGHMQGVLCDPGQPSGLGCVVTGESKCPRDPFPQPVGEREALIKRQTQTGACTFLFPFLEPACSENVSWKQEPWGVYADFQWLPKPHA